MILLKRHGRVSEIPDMDEDADILFLSADMNLWAGIRHGKLLIAGGRKLHFEMLTCNAVLIDEKDDNGRNGM